ncbi:lactate racemase domain-containing protein [Sedimentibacter sp. B4]|uniref:lactate racemase domain-containing protein n=1 Tax=Sedimentibacter sp. B4 TaxID=304766 RepID=UPI0002F191D5|nr:lactate racemase domain-containing protein [Sedimentibacter sp. B4]
MSVINSILDKVELPNMVKVKQKFDRTIIEDIPAEVIKQLNRDEIRNKIKPGMKIAVAVGSRGIASISLIAKTVLDFIKQNGAEPFIVPAMGSHGGATGEGQKEFLNNYGINKKTMEVEIKSSMEVVPVGVNEDGITVYIDKNAFEADGIIILNRIKPHPAFRGNYECGLMKMLTIGLGKQQGAEVCHIQGFGKMARNVEMFARCIIENVNLIAGLAIIENAYDQTRELYGLTPNEIIEKEPELLNKARSLLPRIIPEKLDVLVVDKIGKNFGGDGMDANVTRVFLSPAVPNDPGAPSRIVALDLSDETHGNAMGMGIAASTTRRLFNKIDMEATYPNSLTASAPEASAIPSVFGSDELAIKAAVKFAYDANRSKLRIVRIPNTLHIEYIEVSEALIDELKEREDIEIISAKHSWQFDNSGNLF